MSKRLTKRELEAVCEAIAFRLAGDPDAYDMDTNDDGESVYTRADLESAHRKLSERLPD